ncbi:hypothetical protein ACFSLT_27325 [Novosphingobium resinovorum]
MAKRFILERPIAEAFTAKFVGAARDLKIAIRKIPPRRSAP